MTLPANPKLDEAFSELYLRLPETFESECLVSTLEEGIHEILADLREERGQLRETNQALRAERDFYERLARSFSSFMGADGDPARLARAALHALADVPAIEYGYVVLFQRGNGAPDVVETLGAESPGRLEESVSRGILVRLRQTAEEQYFTDAQVVPDLTGMASVQQMQLRTVFCVPVPGTEGPRGALYVENRRCKDAFSAKVKAAVRVAAGLLAFQLGLLYAHSPGDGSSGTHRRDDGLRGFIGTSNITCQLLRHATLLVAREPLPVLLITGQTGVGKTLMARLLHEHGPRKNGPFVCVSLPNLQPGTVERELFGSVDGAYTDARKSQGLVETAHGGTLFLDEAGATPLEVQAKLLQFLDDRDVRPVGAAAAKLVDVWVVVATNADLEAMVGQGIFREDLYYRLQGTILHVPPLASRRDDIEALAVHFANEASQRLFGRNVFLTPDLLLALRARPWHGNARELKGAVEALVRGHDRHVLTAAELHSSLNGQLPAADVRRLDMDAILRRCRKEILVLARDLWGPDTEEMARRLGKGRSTLYKLLREHDVRLR